MCPGSSGTQKKETGCFGKSCLSPFDFPMPADESFRLFQGTERTLLKHFPKFIQRPDLFMGGSCRSALTETALLVFFAAAAGTGIVSSDIAQDQFLLKRHITKEGDPCRSPPLRHGDDWSSKCLRAHGARLSTDQPFFERCLALPGRLSRDKPFNADILVDIGPVNALAFTNQPPIAPFDGVCVLQSGIPAQWY